ncbi:hypothetical protein UPYG_G00066180 [Umbra pygmaea]|uniref:ATPase AAA-type core domain-containing protein n=1 Tax=Umbra pygmaea TaxID=75934 RepID=A0ABD0XS93_UMBPY
MEMKAGCSRSTHHINDDVPPSVARLASRLHGLKSSKFPKASTQFIEEPLNESVESCDANTQTQRNAVIGCRELIQITALSHGANVQYKLSPNKIPVFPHHLTSQATVQSAGPGRAKPALTTDERVASISITKQDTGKASSPRHSHPHHVKLALPASSWKYEFSGSVRKSFLDEIKASNARFPVRQVFTLLLKKHKENLQESELPDIEVSTTTLFSPVRPKRKHQNEKGDPETVRKRQRSNLGLEEAPLTGYSPSLGQQVRLCQMSEAQPRRSRLSRSHRLRQQQRECLGRCPDLTPDPPNQRESHQSHHFQPQICSNIVHNIEDLLWTEKYRPQHSNEVVGNSASVKKLHSWLKKWKLRADCDERRLQESKREEKNNDTWDCGDFQGEAGGDEVEELCNTMLITGPSGLGKTASVYACAQELGFQVFEVNASSQRSGRHVLTQLKEATQSHQVEVQPSSGLKPAYLSNSSGTSANFYTVPSRVPSTRKVVSSCRKGPVLPHASHCRRGGSSAASTMLANFFKMKSKPKIVNLDGLSLSTKQDRQLQNSVCSITAGTAVGPGSPEVKRAPTDKQSKRAATSLILFEEVEVVFDDDAGFLTAIQTFMKTTRRPVILTTSDSSFSSKFEGKFETILFKTPSVANVSSYLQLLCLAENVRTVPGDVTSVVRLNQVDIRRSILQLQFWACSGGGTAPQRDPVPRCAASCTQNMLGLNTGPIQHLETTLKCHPWADQTMLKLMEILTESWRTGVALLYSNLELLLPLPARTKSSPVHDPQEVPLPGMQGEPTPPDLHLLIPLIPNQPSPVKVSSGSRLRRRKCVSNSSDHSKAIKPHRASLSLGTLNNAEMIKNLNKKLADELVSHCLGAINDFLDLMSFIDASLSSETAHKAGACRPGDFVWTGAEVKDGLLDEMRQEDARMWGCKTVEIQAAVEVLGFHRCLARVSEGWTRAQGLKGEQRLSVVEKLTLPLATHRKGFSISQTTPCEPSVVQRRREHISSILSSKALSTLGNKQAVVVDYLPILRIICYSERKQGRGNGRFLHYLSSHLSLPKTSWRFLAEDFP